MENKTQKAIKSVYLNNRRKSACWLTKNNQECTTRSEIEKRKRVKLNSDDEDDFDEHSNQFNLTIASSKKRRKGVNLQDEPLYLKCYWEDCDFTLQTLNNNCIKYVDHTFSHILNINTDENNEFCCKWDDCSYQTQRKEIFEMHFSYHSYLTKLKCIGENHKARVQLMSCQLTDIVPLPDRQYPFQCSWSDCNQIFFRVQYYFHHVMCHVFGEPTLIEQKPGIKLICCLWLGCTSTVPTKSSLQVHVRSHIGEKIAACSTCNATFVSLTKFTDHLKRQGCNENEQFKCSHCYKFFASERLLRNHVRVHINHYKCNLCDMTCITPASLSRHIRYRHLPYRPFKCNQCEHSTVTKRDLDLHMTTHSSVKLFECMDCNSKFRTLIGLRRHYDRIHKASDDDEDPRMYECHCCSSRFIRGATLTKHLIRKHDYQWPSGHSRFRYKQDPTDGMYRLQTVRFESVEVTQEIISSGPVVDSNQSLIDQEESETAKEINRRISIEDNLSSSSEEFKHLLNTKNIVPTDKSIVIMICEVDDSGNMIKSETVESNELRIETN